MNRADELLLEQRLPILARIPRLSRRTLSRYLSGREQLPPTAWEAYRTLRASLANAGADGGFPRTVLVSSSIPGEGKTLTSINLAITMALSGVKVVLVDADLRRPMIATAFGIPARTRGFATLLGGEADPLRALVSPPHQPRELKLLLASPQQAWMVDLLQRERIERVLDRLKQNADVVIIDSPPVGEVADALALADVVETVDHRRPARSQPPRQAERAAPDARAARHLAGRLRGHEPPPLARPRLLRDRRGGTAAAPPAPPPPSARAAPEGDRAGRAHRHLTGPSGCASCTSPRACRTVRARRS